MSEARRLAPSRERSGVIIILTTNGRRLLVWRSMRLNWLFTPLPNLTLEPSRRKRGWLNSDVRRRRACLVPR